MIHTTHAYTKKMYNVIFLTFWYASTHLFAFMYVSILIYLSIYRPGFSNFPRESHPSEWLLQKFPTIPSRTYHFLCSGPLIPFLSFCLSHTLPFFPLKLTGDLIPLLLRLQSSVLLKLNCFFSSRIIESLLEFVSYSGFSRLLHIAQEGSCFCHSLASL